MDKNLDLYNQNLLDEIPYDLLSYTLSTDDASLPAEQGFTNTFFSNIDGQTINSGVTNAAPISSSGLSNFYSGNVNQISPLDTTFLPQNALATPLPTPNYCTPSTHPLQDDLEEFLTPLVSPAITPNYTDIYEFLDPPNDQYFTPLSSPALPPSNNVSFNDNGSSMSPKTNIPNAALLSQQLAQIEAKQQLLRDQLSQSPTSPKAYRKSPLALFSSRNQAPPSPLPFNSNKKRPSLRQKIALASPQLHSSHNHHISLPTTPATPASLMKMSHQPQTSTTPLGITTSDSAFTNNANNITEMVDVMPSLPPTAFTTPTDTTIPAIAKKRKLAPSSPMAVGSSPRTLKPLVSPFLQPDMKSVNLNAFTPGIENRRSAHKVAEQRRRDTLKQSFDSLRDEIADVLVTDSLNFDNNKKPENVVREEKQKEVKLMSKVLLLQHSYEYIVRLKNDGKHKDRKMEEMQTELDKLRNLAATNN